jgi:YidC/Oxa1 family membrane protein insertase
MVEFLGKLFDPLVDLLGAGLQLFHAWGAPWWFSIVILTVVVRTALFPLTVRQVKNMRQLQELRPQMEEIRARHKDDPRKQQQKMMELYAERRVNPLGGCLPLFVQVPIFVGLYYTIKEFESLQSFTSGGLLWFKDLTASDPHFVLPAVYVLTMMAAQEIAIRHTAPQQRQLMRLLPPVVGLFMALAGFPAGLFVYWIASNLITFAQNAVIYRPFVGNPAERGQQQETPRFGGRYRRDDRGETRN